MSEVFDAVATGDGERLRAVLTDHPELAEAKDATGVSVVLHALYRRRFDLVRIILAEEPPLDVFDLAALGVTEALAVVVEAEPEAALAWSNDGFTALHLAAFFAKPEAVRVLLAAGSDPSAVARNPSGVQPLHSAAAGRDADVVAQLIDAGADPNATQHGGWTPLHAAALHGDTELARLLLAGGARTDLAADDGSRPLDCARRELHEDTAALLG